MIRSMCPVIAFVAVVALAACALDPNSSYVAGLQHPADAAVLGEGVAAFVTDSLPASSTVVLDPTPVDQSSNAVTPALATILQQRGFTVADAAQPPPGTHRVRYLVTPLDNGDLVRVTIDAATEGAQFFVRDTAGDLQTGGPVTVTQAAEVMK